MAMSSFTVLSLLLAMAAPSLLWSEASALAVAPRVPRGPATAAEFLSAINDARANVSVPPLSWNATIAQNAKAQVSWLRSAGGCDLAQLGRSPVPRLTAAVGMTTYHSSGRRAPADAVAAWVSERQWYDRGANACAAGKDCRSYKMVVTRAWQQVGCAVVACPSGGTVMACEYSPGTNSLPDPDEPPY